MKKLLLIVLPAFSALPISAMENSKMGVVTRGRELTQNSAGLGALNRSVSPESKDIVQGLKARYQLSQKPAVSFDDSTDNDTHMHKPQQTADQQSYYDYITSIVWSQPKVKDSSESNPLFASDSSDVVKVDSKDLEGYEEDTTKHEIDVIPVGNESAPNHIALLSIHGTWANNAGMGANAERAFTDAIRKHAEELAKNNNALVDIIAPNWGGSLTHIARQRTANGMHDVLKELNKNHAIDEIHGIAHSHGCNILLNLAQFGNDSGFNIQSLLKSMTLLAPPRVEVKEFYNYPKGCTTLAFYSENDATQQLGSVERGQGFEQCVPVMRKNAGQSYNINVRYLPEIVRGYAVGKPNHKSIKQQSLIDCLPTIQELVKHQYKNYYDLQLWIPKKGESKVHRPILAVNNETVNNEPDEKTKEIVQSLQKNVRDLIQNEHPEFQQPTGYLLDNLVRGEILYSDPESAHVTQ